PERVNLENVRRQVLQPDIGDIPQHPTAGATAVGARKLLIAYNINLATNDVALARRIARKVRASSGGFPCVKGMGVLLASRNQAQVSMNLTDFEVTPIHQVFDAVAAEAAAAGVTIASSEIIGLVPRKALEQAAEHYLRIENFRAGVILENCVHEQ